MDAHQLRRSFTDFFVHLSTGGRDPSRRDEALEGVRRLLAP